MSSYEAAQTKAYSEDLRWRVVYQRKVLEFNIENVATNLGVSAATIHRVEKLFDNTGDVKKREYPSDHGHTLRKLTEYEQFFIIQLILNKPSIYLREIQQELLNLNGTSVEISTICRFLHRSGFTRNKLTLVAVQRSEELRQEFRSDISIFSKEMFVFVDETGCDGRDSTRRFGYSLRGKRAVSQKLLARGKRIPAIGVMSMEGLLDCHVVENTVDGEEFSKSLLPHLMPFNGINAHSIVVLDNCAVHHIDGIMEVLQSFGIFVLFLPPYSPDMNPIENVFSKVKAYLKANELALEALDGPTEIVLSAFISITQQDCRNWISDCGY